MMKNFLKSDGGSGHSLYYFDYHPHITHNLFLSSFSIFLRQNGVGAHIGWLVPKESMERGTRFLSSVHSRQFDVSRCVFMNQEASNVRAERRDTGRA